MDCLWRSELLGAAADASICVVVKDCSALPETFISDPTVSEAGQFVPHVTKMPSDVFVLVSMSPSSSCIQKPLNASSVVNRLVTMASAFTKNGVKIGFPVPCMS